MKGRSRRRRFRSLTVTLTLAFLGISMGTLAFAGAIDIYLSNLSQQSMIAEHQDLIARNAALEVSEYIDQKLAMMESVASTSRLFTAGKEESELVINKMIGLDPSFRQIIVLDGEGKEKASVSRISKVVSGEIIETNITNIIEQVSDGKDYIGSVYIDSITNEPMVMLAVPVKDVFGEPMGVLMAETNLKFMWDLVGNLKIGNNGLAYVVDSEGYLISFGDTGRVLRRENLYGIPEVRKFVDDNEEEQDSNADVSTGIMGTQTVASFYRLGTPDWAIVVELPVDEAYGSVIVETQIIGYALVASLVLALLTGFYVSKRVTRPLTRLRDATIEIARGKTNTRIDVGSGNEIGDLSSSFNKMVEEIKSYKSKTEEHEETLTKKVNERTEELNRNVKELEDTKAAILNMMEDVDKTNKDLIEAQARLKRSLGELKLVDKKKDEFISIAAHELKTPLTAIHGFSQLLKDKKVIGNDAKRRNFLNIMDKETERLARLVTDILELSRIDLGTIKVTRERFDLGEVLETVKKEMQIHAKNKGIRLEFDAKKSVMINTDREKLTQILINIINNAIKYTDKGSITVDVSENGGRVHFEVTDTGIGIEKGELKKIFGRFYQIDSSYTRKAGGTGLGLALCKEYVELLGGRIWAESKVGKGSTFHIEMPLSPA